MRISLFRKKLRKKIKDLSNSILFSFVVLLSVSSLILYPFVLTAQYSFADDGSSSVGESSSSAQEKDDEESEEEDNSEEEEEADEEEAEDEENEAQASDEKEEIASEESDEKKIIEEESPIEEQESEDAGAEPGSTQTDETTATGTTEISEDNDSDEDDFWKTCDLSDEEEELIEDEEECEECREKTDCDEIKNCLEEKIENINETEMENEISSQADTGNNAISETDNASAPDKEIGISQETTDEISDESLENVESEESEEADETMQLEEEGSEPEISIQTGEATAVVNVYNEVNTNIISENYAESILNIYGNYEGDVNLLEKFQALLDKISNNSQLAESIKLIEVNNENEAEVKNILLANANTGNNSIESGSEGSGEAEIETGDAGAAVNLVNFINRNMVGNNWLFSVINVFGSWFGNLIVPGEGLLEITESSGDTVFDVTNENDADVENDVLLDANTGENSITGSGSDSSVVSGNATSSTQVKNIINTNITRNNWFLLMINNMGLWSGSILGWSSGGSATNIFHYDFDILDSNPENDGFLSALFKIFNKNTANVSNSVSASANTGGNSISGAEAENIYTGNAYAGSNILNFINTNITGNNWMFGMVNVMGIWEGNAIFAYPDLKISISDGMDDATPGEELSYSVEYENVGQAACEDAKVYVGLPKYFSYKSDSAGGNYSSESGTMVWDLGALEPGEKKSFTVKGELSEEFPEGETTLMAGAGITTSTKEIESGNNSATDKTKVSNYSVVDYVEYPEIDPEIKITREVAPGTTFRQGQSVIYSMIVENEGDSPVYNLIVEDELRNETGNIGILQWPIGEIEEGESFLIQYQIAISSFAPLGTYTNWAVAYGNNAYGEEYESKKATSQIEVIMGLAYNIYNENIAIPTAQAKEKNISQVLGAETWKEDNDDRNLWLGLISLILLFLIYELYIFRKNREEESATQPYS